MCRAAAQKESFCRATLAHIHPRGLGARHEASAATVSVFYTVRIRVKKLRAKYVRTIWLVASVLQCPLLAWPFCWDGLLPAVWVSLMIYNQCSIIACFPMFSTLDSRQVTVMSCLIGKIFRPIQSSFVPLAKPKDLMWLPPSLTSSFPAMALAVAFMTSTFLRAISFGTKFGNVAKLTTFITWAVDSHLCHRIFLTSKSSTKKFSERCLWQFKIETLISLQFSQGVLVWFL